MTLKARQITVEAPGFESNRAAIVAESVDKVNKQFDVVFATENPVLRNYWYFEEKFNEVLVCEKKNMRTERLDNNAVPLLDTHNNYSIENQYGKVIAWRIETINGVRSCVATIRYTRQEEKQKYWPDIEDGIISSISVGPRIYSYERIPHPTDPKGTPTYRAIDWEPYEVSFASTPADYLSTIRSAGKGEQNKFPIQINNTVMVLTQEQKDKVSARAAELGIGGKIVEGIFARGLSLDESLAELEEIKRSLPTVNTPAPAPTNNEPANRNIPANTPAPTTAPTGEDLVKRTLEIQALGAKSKLSEEQVRSLVELKDGNGNYLGLEEVKARMLDMVTAQEEQRNMPKGGNVSVGGNDEAIQTRNAMVEVLMHRAAPGMLHNYNNLNPKTKGEGLSVRAQDMKHMNMMDMARYIVSVNGGGDVLRMSDYEITKRAFSTTDLPDLFTTSINRMMMAYYMGIVPDWELFSRYMPSADFKLNTGVKVDANITFEEIGENGEYKEANLVSNEKATLKLKTYGRKFSITRQTLINDDLNVIGELPRLTALGGRTFQSKKVWGLIIDNATTPDGNALFSGAHANYNSVGSQLNSDALNEARTMMRRQTSPQGQILNIVPKYLIVPPELEGKARQLTTPVLANQTDNVNEWSGLVPIVNPYITSAQEFYLAADPNMVAGCEGIVHSYLSGYEGLQTESFVDQHNDNLVIKARLDFDAQIWGYQPWYKNVGASGSIS